MAGLRVIAAAAAVANAILCAVAEPAQAGETNGASFLWFSGADLWRGGAFLYGGALWSPAGLDASGFTLKLLLSGGNYTYYSGGLQTEVNGGLLSAAAMPGWRLIRDSLVVSLYGGPLVQDYRLTPDDPGSHLRGAYIGGQFAADVWYQPSPAIMVALNGMIATIGPTGSLRGAVGERIFEPVFIGPEAQAIWCGFYDELRIGAHLTGWRVGALEWSAAAGLSVDTDHRFGPYVRLDVNVRY